MDDPWGSPWADAIRHPIPTKQSAGTLPTAPVTLKSPGLEEKPTSPWNDTNDDGFGEWTSPADENDTLGFEVATGWTGNTRSEITKNTTALPMPWNDGATIFDEHFLNVTPNSSLKKDGIVRNPSPDPWKIADLSAEKNESIPELGDGLDRKDTDTPAEYRITGPYLEDGDGTLSIVTSVENGVLRPQEDGVGEKSVTPGEESIPRPQTDGIDGKPFTSVKESAIPFPAPNVTPVEPLMFIGHEAAESAENELSVDISTDHAKPKPNDIADPDPIYSRPSSSPSEHSHHNEITQDSPRTSIDEDPRRPQVPGKVSGKVLELVQHFDGLAKVEVDPGLGPTNSNEGILEDEEDVDDFGDFEEGKSENEEPEENSLNGEIEPPQSKPKLERNTFQQHSPSSSISTTKEYGPVEFKIDIRGLDKLYSIAEDEPSEKVLISDTVGHDSFSSTNERKTWYRISRYGTMRKHNAGEDDNNIRINWGESQVRADTMKIVGRWMEEDRISGHVVLGGGSKVGSIFGWNDPKAEPLPLSRAFAAKPEIKNMAIPKEPSPEVPREWPKGLVKSPTSKSQSPSKIRKSSARSGSITEIKSATQSPVAKFGWNNGPNTDQSVTMQTLAEGIAPENKSTVTAFSPVPHEVTPMAAAIKNVSSSASNDSMSSHSIVESTIPSLPLATSNPVKDDDDWGEMVSSPTSIAQNLQKSKPLYQQPDTGKTPSLVSSPLSVTPVPNYGIPVGIGEILTPRSAPPTMNTPIIEGATPNSTTGGNDPWASADFSFFEKAPASAQKHFVSRQTPPKSVTFGTPLTQSSQSNQNQENEQDKIVQSVIKGLPDLSYMLRR